MRKPWGLDQEPPRKGDGPLENNPDTYDHNWLFLPEVGVGESAADE